MHSWQNRTRCRDGVKVLWYHSLLVWLVFEASIPTWTCFHSENFLCLVSAVLLVLSFRNGKREERREGEAKGKMHG